MSEPTIEAIFAYALIPIYVFGLLVLVAIIVRAQSGLFAPRDEHAGQGHKPFSLYEYGFVLVLLALFVIMTVLTRRRSL